MVPRRLLRGVHSRMIFEVTEVDEIFIKIQFSIHTVLAKGKNLTRVVDVNFIGSCSRTKTWFDNSIMCLSFLK